MLGYSSYYHQLKQTLALKGGERLVRFFKVGKPTIAILLIFRSEEMFNIRQTPSSYYSMKTVSVV
jgi:hypothetical protein